MLVEISFFLNLGVLSQGGKPLNIKKEHYNV